MRFPMGAWKGIQQLHVESWPPFRRLLQKSTKTELCGFLEKVSIFAPTVLELKFLIFHVHTPSREIDIFIDQ